MSDREIAIEVLEELLEFQHKSSHDQSEVESDINTFKDELKYLDEQNSYDSKLIARVKTRIRELEEKITNGFFTKRPYPSELYHKDLKTKIAYLNETFQDDCPLCKNGTLKLVASGKVWMCTNGCGGKRWCTTDEIQLLGVDVNRGQS